jgi:hypothetical protein
MKGTRVGILTQHSFPGMALMFFATLRHFMITAERLSLFPLRENTEVKG